MKNRSILGLALVGSIFLFAAPAAAVEEFPGEVKTTLGLGYDRKSVAAALTLMRTDRVDSDGDGVLDVDELVAGTDPTSSAPGARMDDGPKGGCSTSRGSGDASWMLSTVVMLAAGRFLRRRSKRIGRDGDDPRGHREEREPCDATTTPA